MRQVQPVRGGMAGAGGRGPGGPGGDGAARERSAGLDLSQMLSRLPTETLAGLKVGDAVMIVATSPSVGYGDADGGDAAGGRGSDSAGVAERADDDACRRGAWAEGIRAAKAAVRRKAADSGSRAGKGFGYWMSAAGRTSVRDEAGGQRMFFRDMGSRRFLCVSVRDGFREFRSSGVRMLVDGLGKKRMSGWLGAGLAGVLVAGALGLERRRLRRHRRQRQPASAAGLQAGKTRVHGVVTDPDGALIPGATVTLYGARAGGEGDVGVGRIVQRGGESGDVYGDGDDAGVCDVHRASGLEIGGANGMTLNAKLQIGVQSQVVTVQANSVQLSVDPDSNQSAIVLTGKDLDALSDDPDELSDELTALAGPAAGPNGGQIYVDGFTGGQLPPKSSIREIRINQNPFSAEYDQLGYGRVEVFTKPGTDKLHGNFQMNGNASQFNSGNPLATGYQPPYHTIFGFGNLTGPLNKIASYNVGGSYRRY